MDHRHGVFMDGRHGVLMDRRHAVFMDRRHGVFMDRRHGVLMDGRHGARIDRSVTRSGSPVGAGGSGLVAHLGGAGAGVTAGAEETQSQATVVERSWRPFG